MAIFALKIEHVVAALVGFVVVYQLAGRALLSYFTRAYTSIPDLPALGTSRRSPRESGTAVICGGSLGGLLAARICTDHFERVIVVEPEEWTFTAEAGEPPNLTTRVVDGPRGAYRTFEHKRSRIHQYTSIHGYQALLTIVLRNLFPGFEDHARKWGLTVGMFDPHALMPSGKPMLMPNKQYRGKLPLQIGGPRRILEPLIRNRVKDARPQIEYVHGTVTGFVLGENNTVSAVSVRKQDGTSVDIECALAVDCTGVSQTGLKLLSRAFPALPQLRANYNPRLNGVTFDLPLPPDYNERVSALTFNKDGTGGPAGGPYDPDFAQFMFMLVPDPRDDFRTLNLCRQGENGLVYTAGGWGDCELPVSIAQLREHMRQIKGRTLPDYVWALVDMIEPVADQVVVTEGHITSCSRIHYEKAGDILPHNFVALGDAVMRLNPLYGEGVNKVAIGVTTLDGVLRSYSTRDRAFGRTFFQRLANRTQDRWESAKALDYGHKTTIPVEGETLDEGSFLRWCNSKLSAILHKNEYAASVLWHSMHFLGPGQLAMSPRIVAAVLWEMVWPTP